MIETGIPSADMQGLLCSYVAMMLSTVYELVLVERYLWCWRLPLLNSSGGKDRDRILCGIIDNGIGEWI